MGCGVTDEELKKTIRRLAHELADAHALLNSQQKKRPFGQHVFNAKQMAYALLHKLHQAQQATKVSEISNA